jgi:hypothetical protein
MILVIKNQLRRYNIGTIGALAVRAYSLAKPLLPSREEGSSGETQRPLKHQVYHLRRTGMTKINQNTALIVSAHSADFVWRAGGAIALYAEAYQRLFPEVTEELQ